MSHCSAGSEGMSAGSVRPPSYQSTTAAEADLASLQARVVVSGRRCCFGGHWLGEKKKKSYIGSENSIWGHIGAKTIELPTTKFRLGEVQQAEKENRSSNKKERKMIAERQEFQIFNSKQQVMYRMDKEVHVVLF
eukprot:1149028-Pelagomonas_calceolata.AAC.2